MPDAIRFYFRGAVQSVADAPPTRTILQHLRENLLCTGSKEGCAEGDCGACTVVVGELRDGKLELKPINACIQLLPSLDGKALFTVEDLQQANGDLHPVQQAMVECHGSQCGFCTPGFVMSLWSLYLANAGASEPPTRKEIDTALSGNLCRCTGYRPIIRAALRMFELPPPYCDRLDRAALQQTLQGLQRSDNFTYRWRDQEYFAPRTLRQALALRSTHPDAILVAGCTDVGLRVTKQLQDVGDMIYLGQVGQLHTLCENAEWLEIGAGVTLSDAYAAILRHYRQELSEFCQRFASLPIRNAGTLGGNLANGSPIGDSMPWLIALGAKIVLTRWPGEHGQRREMPLEDFYLGYQQKDLGADEIMLAVRIPLPTVQAAQATGRRSCLRSYKLAKRFDQDISAVCAGFFMTFENAHIVDARIAFGGMAATPRRANQTEAFLRGKSWDEANLQSAMALLAQDFAPLSDMRASAAYRMTAAQNLLRRFWHESRLDAPLPNAALNAFAASTMRK